MQAESKVPDALWKPRNPTRHLPGTVGKVEVLARRARNAEFLWHPNDARLREGDPTEANSIKDSEAAHLHPKFFQDADGFEAALSDG